MKRLSLSQACLLHAAGELGPKSSRRLMDHIDTYPAAMMEYDQTVAHLASLNSLPAITDEILPLKLEQIRRDIFNGVLARQRQEQRRELKRKLRPIFYRGMSVISGVAAALVVMAGVHMVQMRAAARAQRLQDATTSFRELAQTDMPASHTLMLQQMGAIRMSSDGASGIDADSPIGASNALMQFFNALDHVKLGVNSSIGTPQ